MEQERKKDLHLIIAFIIIVSIALFYLMQTSLGRYRKQANANVEASIASWIISVNNEQIGKGATLTNKIIPTFEKNDNVKEGTIAPGTKGYFDLKIESSKVDVNFTYDITAAVSEVLKITDLKITSYLIDSIDEADKITYVDGIKGTILKNTPETNIRVFIEWDDDDTTQTMDNEKDTEIGISDIKEASITVNLKFAQAA